MKHFRIFALFVSTACCYPLDDSLAHAEAPFATNPTTNVTFRGKLSNNIECFLNIRFGHDTSGNNRFAHPVPFSYPAGTTVDASQPGPACPQAKVPVTGFSIFSNVTNISEDCLTLRIDRFANTIANTKLPVMVWIFGGGDSLGQIYDAAYDPTGLILGAEARGTPVLYVAMK